MMNHIIKLVVMFLLVSISAFSQRVVLKDSAYLCDIKLRKCSYSKEQLLKICIREYAKTKGFKKCYWPSSENGKLSNFYYVSLDTVGEHLYIDMLTPMHVLRRYERLFPDEKSVFPNRYIEYKKRIFVYKEGKSEPSEEMLGLLNTTCNYAETKYDDGCVILCEYGEDRRFVVDISKKTVEVFKIRTSFEPWNDKSFKVRPEDRDTLSFRSWKMVNVDEAMINCFDSVTTEMDTNLLGHYQYGLVSFLQTDSCQVAKIRLANICDFQTTDTFVGYVEGEKLLFLFRNTYENEKNQVDSSESINVRYFKIDLMEMNFYKDRKDWPCAFDDVTKHINLIFRKIGSQWCFDGLRYGKFRLHEFYFREAVNKDFFEQDEFTTP